MPLPVLVSRMSLLLEDEVVAVTLLVLVVVLSEMVFLFDLILFVDSKLYDATGTATSEVFMTFSIVDEDSDLVAVTTFDFSSIILKVSLFKRSCGIVNNLIFINYFVCCLKLFSNAGKEEYLFLINFSKSLEYTILSV